MATNPRYRGDWLEPFRAAVGPELRADVVIIDIGGGRTPALARAALPSGAIYIGIDLSARELEAAPKDSYDDMVVGDVTNYLPALEGRADLVVSWQTLEHVAPLEEAIANVHTYLQPGGMFVAQFSGRWSAFALLNRILPPQVAKVVLDRFLGRNPESVFPAVYDRCTYSDLVKILEGWSSARVVPRYRGAQYFRFSGPLQAMYLLFEDLIVRGRHRNLATHYLVVARK